jgi:hypothetical protein
MSPPLARRFDSNGMFFDKTYKHGQKNISNEFNYDTGVLSIEELIGNVSPVASDLITGGGVSGQRMLGDARDASIAPLMNILNKGERALGKESALLGNSGKRAQEVALGRIKLTPLEQEQQRIENDSFMAQRVARGGAGGGNTIAQMIQLKGGQQSRVVEDRLSRLSNVSKTGMSALSDILNLTERLGTSEAAIPLESSQSIANILTGTAAPIASERQSRAEAGALADVSSAQARQNQTSQLTNIIGQAYQPGMNAYNYYAGNTGVATSVTPTMSGGYTTGATISPMG